MWSLWIRQPLESMDLFTKVLSGPMFEAQANVVFGAKGSKSKTMIDRQAVAYER